MPDTPLPPLPQPPGKGQGDGGPVRDDDLTIPISAIEHYSYCPRQCALIHIEQSYTDNVYTVRGQLAHQRVDSTDQRANRGVPTLRGIPLWSDAHSLIGRADTVELRPAGPYPVEYKSGRRRGAHPDLQLCAQALCLEEMLGRPVPAGAVYYVAARRQLEIVFDAALRARTIEVIEAIRAMLAEFRLPPAPDDARCRHCSLRQECLPGVVAQPARLRGLQGALFTPWAPPGGPGAGG